MDFKKRVKKKLQILLLFSWLLQQGVENQVKRTLFIVLSGFLGVGLYAFSFALLLSYARYQIDGHEVVYKGLHLSFPVGNAGVYACAILALFVGILSGTCTYIGQRGILNVVQRFHRDAIAKTIFLFRGSYKIENVSQFPFLTDKHDFRHIPTIYCNYLAISLKIILEAIQPIITLIFSLCLLFYLNLKATLLLLPFVVWYLYIIALVAQKSTSLQGDYLSRLSQINPSLFEYFSLIENSSHPGYDFTFVNSFLNKLKIENVLFPFYERILVTFRSGYFSNIFLTASTVGLFVLFALQFEDFKTSWSSIIVYLIALRFTGQSFKKLSTQFIGLSRFYPVVHVCHKYISQMHVKKIDHIVDNGQNLVWIDDYLKNDKNNPIDIGDSISFILWMPFGSQLSFTPGRKVGIQTLLQKKGYGGSNIFFQGHVKALGKLTVLEVFYGSSLPENFLEEFTSICGQLGLEKEVEDLGDLSDCLYNSKFIEKSSKELQYVIAHGHLFFEGDGVVVLDLKSFFPLNVDFGKKFLSKMSSYSLLFSSSNIDSVLKTFIRLALPDTSHTIVVSDTKHFGTYNTAILDEHRQELEKISEELQEDDHLVKKQSGNIDDSINDEVFL